jgi:hypothetical protein
MNPLILLVLQQLPQLIALVRDEWKKAHPGAEAVTDADVIAALQLAVNASVAMDDKWLRDHPAS